MNENGYNWGGHWGGVKEEIKSCLYFFATFIKIGVVWLFVNELFP